MDLTEYLILFKKAADRLDKQQLRNKQLQVATGEILDSVFLKLYKTSWANPAPDILVSPSRIFFSIWVSEKTIAEQKVFYNIHALKLRELQGYRITSRDFALAFRKKFKKHQADWPNVSVDFGPLTLMEGWISLGDKTIINDIQTLAEKFLPLDAIIDDLLNGYRKPGI